MIVAGTVADLFRIEPPGAVEFADEDPVGSLGLGIRHPGHPEPVAGSAQGRMVVLAETGGEREDLFQLGEPQRIRARAGAGSCLACGNPLRRERQRQEPRGKEPPRQAQPSHEAFSLPKESAIVNLKDIAAGVAGAFATTGSPW